MLRLGSVKWELKWEALYAKVTYEACYEVYFTVSQPDSSRARNCIRCHGEDPLAGQTLGHRSFRQVSI
jgi:hypothetical protein